MHTVSVEENMAPNAEIVDEFSTNYKRGRRKLETTQIRKAKLDNLMRLVLQIQLSGRASSSLITRSTICSMGPKFSVVICSERKCDLYAEEA